MPKLLFGKANRDSKSYEAMVQAYQNKLQQGGKAPAVYVPKTPATLRATQKRIEQVKGLVTTLINKIDKYSESELDQMILPHPLLGKLTLREMGYFAAYHVAHHHKQAEANLL
jgi:lipopolysaccharide biosynthesis regulator YciM